MRCSNRWFDDDVVTLHVRYFPERREEAWAKPVLRKLAGLPIRHKTF